MSKTSTRWCVGACLINLVDLNIKHDDFHGATAMGFLFTIVVALELLRWINRQLKEKHNADQ